MLPVSHSQGSTDLHLQFSFTLSTFSSRSSLILHMHVSITWKQTHTRSGFPVTGLCVTSNSPSWQWGEPRVHPSFCASRYPPLNLWEVLYYICVCVCVCVVVCLLWVWTLWTYSRPTCSCMCEHITETETFCFFARVKVISLLRL